MILENKDINSYEVTDLTFFRKARACLELDQELYIGSTGTKGLPSLYLGNL